MTAVENTVTVYYASSVQVSLNVIILVALIFLRQEMEGAFTLLYRNLVKFANFATYTLSTALLILYIILYVQLSSIDLDNFQTYIDLKCTDDSVMEFAFHRIIETITYIKTRVLVGLIATVLIICIYTFFMLCSYGVVLKDLKRKYKPQKKQSLLLEDTHQKEQ